jgi:hypothetical protein
LKSPAKRVIEGNTGVRIEERQDVEEEDVSSYWMTLRKEMILETERASARSHSVENSL